ncbi:MAG: histidine triad nucleotide-binding protein [Fluviibacter sp.]|mgnify:CR=1 FL=1|jgi:histidine triad (HIT) family protein
MSEHCIFCKIIAGKIPSQKVYEDELVYAFNDIHPQRPVHILVIPKHHLVSLQDAAPADEAALGRMLAVANRLAVEAGSPNGFRVIINNGEIGCQEVPHLHAHIVGGDQPVGPMLKHPD